MTIRNPNLNAPEPGVPYQLGNIILMNEAWVAFEPKVGLMARVRCPEIGCPLFDVGLMTMKRPKPHKPASPKQAIEAPGNPADLLHRVQVG